MSKFEFNFGTSLGRTMNQLSDSFPSSKSSSLLLLQIISHVARITFLSYSICLCIGKDNPLWFDPVLYVWSSLNQISFYFSFSSMHIFVEDTLEFSMNKANSSLSSSSLSIDALIQCLLLFACVLTYHHLIRMIRW